MATRRVGSRLRTANPGLLQEDGKTEAAKPVDVNRLPEVKALESLHLSHVAPNFEDVATRVTSKTDALRTLVVKLIGKQPKGGADLLGPLPASLNRANAATLLSSHWVTAKLDGLRAMLLVTSQVFAELRTSRSLRGLCRALFSSTARSRSTSSPPTRTHKRGTWATRC